MHIVIYPVLFFASHHRRGLSQSEHAELSHIPQSTIANYETGKWSPNFHIVSAFAGALNIPFDFLKPLNYDDYDKETRNQYIRDFYYSLDEALNIAPRVKRFVDIRDEIDFLIKSTSLAMWLRT